jgi:hypothetical protein
MHPAFRWALRITAAVLHVFKQIVPCTPPPACHYRRTPIARVRSTRAILNVETSPQALLLNLAQRSISSLRLLLSEATRVALAPELSAVSRPTLVLFVHRPLCPTKPTLALRATLHSTKQAQCRDNTPSSRMSTLMLSAMHARQMRLKCRSRRISTIRH